MTSPTDLFRRHAPIHPDSLSDYEIWAGLLIKWNPKINLVAAKSMGELWDRHMLDSAQILPFLTPDASIVADFGSGAGFPGLAIAIQAKYAHPDRTVHLFESGGKKATFLKTVSRETNVPTQVWADRIENVAPAGANIITARAFAPLDRLFPLANYHLAEGGSLVLLKGRTFRSEIDDAQSDWQFDWRAKPSLTDPDGVVLQIESLKSR